MKRRVLALATTVVTIAAMAFLYVMPAHATTTTINVANDHVTCNTLSGSIAFATHLKNSGANTGANKITVHGALGGCSDEDDGFVLPFKGTISATLNTNNGNSCAGLFGPTNISGSAQVIWTPHAGQAFTPTVTIGTVQKAASELTFSQVNAGIFAVPASESPWSASYGKFSLGVQYGVAPIGTTVDFTGGDNGATGWFDGTTQEDAGNIGTMCGSTTGVGLLHFGIGAVHFG